VTPGAAVLGARALSAVRGAAVLGAVLLAATAAVAQLRISNSIAETRSAARGLEGEVRRLTSQGGVVWIGYRVPMIPGPRHMCCFDNFSSGACRLDGGGGVSMSTATPGDTAARGSRVTLEPPSDLVVLARIENGIVGRVRMFTPDCDVDGGNARLVWFDEVRPDDSIAWLSSLVSAPASTADWGSRVADMVMTAISLHDASTADRVLVGWARNHPDRRTRGKALFWLGVRASREAFAAIVGAIDNDPDTEVKKKAVFALSQMPKDQGVPKLIEVARANRNPQVRKQAMFWLGQSGDPRALQFFEEILLK
jgi:HEAT repeats